MRTWMCAAMTMLCSLGGGVDSALAQAESGRVVAEGIAGWGGFIDEQWIDHLTIGGGVRARVTPRIALGPEVLYLRGPAGDRDLTLSGIVTIDLLGGGSARRIAPYVVFGGGYLRSTQLTGTGPFTSGAGTVSGGGGVRIAVGERWFVAPEMRIGFQPELRIGAAVGVRLP